MKNGRCPKCGSTTVHYRPGGLGFGNQNMIYVYADKNLASSTVSYVCTACGYFEEYLTDKDALALVAAKWSKVRAS